MPQETESKSVALILEHVFKRDMVAIAREMPVWILSTEANDKLVVLARQKFGPGRITTVLAKGDESPADLFARALYAIDEHHGDASQAVPFSELYIYGRIDGIPSELASELNFKSTTTIEGGIVVRK